MKKLITMVLVICIAIISGNAFGQETKKENERKGGIAVGGFDNTRQDKAVKRSVEIPEEAAPAEKALPPEPAAAPAPPADEFKNKEALEGKDSGQARAQTAKEKHEARKNSKSKGKKK